MTDPNDMEDPQHGEILPPMLLDAYWENRASDGGVYSNYDRAFKDGMEFALELHKPLMQAALPYYEAGVCDTRSVQADAGKLAELARYKEIAEYVYHNPEKL